MKFMKKEFSRRLLSVLLLPVTGIVSAVTTFEFLEFKELPPRSASPFIEATKSATAKSSTYSATSEDEKITITMEQTLVDACKEGSFSMSIQSSGGTSYSLTVDLSSLAPLKIKDQNYIVTILHSKDSGAKVLTTGCSNSERVLSEVIEALVIESPTTKESKDSNDVDEDSLCYLKDATLSKAIATVNNNKGLLGVGYDSEKRFRIWYASFDDLISKLFQPTF